MADRVGQQLGNYQVLRVLGRGAFAEVYLAEHRYLEVPAAIKVLHVQMEPDTHEQFRREARTIAHLQHPHIVRVLDFGFQEQTPYLVMEYTPGGTLRTRYPKGTRLPPGQIIAYVKQIASALDYAHQQRVIHRDVKPENMLLSANDEVVLSDFGLAVVQQSLDSLSTQNQAGTPVYMAPEQIQRKPCAASDQYALGVLVYEWLCGEPPFRGSLFEVLSQHLHQAPPSLCTRLPSLPPAVEDVVFGALAKEPQARFVSVQDFAEALEEVCDATEPLSVSWPVEELSRDQLSLSDTRPDLMLAPSPKEEEPSSSSTQPRVLTQQQTERTEELVSLELLSPAAQTHASSQQKGRPVSWTNRQRFLRKVRAYWIAGVFEHSLHGAALLALGLQQQPDAVANPWQLMLQEPAGVPHPLPTGTRITEVYDAAEGELLILGAPGSGKSTLLLELARDLLSRAEQDEQHPLPVVFTLSSWASKPQPLADWLVEELNSTYQVPRRLGRAWVDADQILPLLDGLDEVAPKDRTRCIETINTYRQTHGLLPLVVCSRSADYLAQSTRVRLGSAVMIQPLTPQQVEDYLASGGEPLWALRVALQQDAALRELTSTPLMLSILTLTYHNIPIEDLLQRGSLADRQRQLFERYVERMLRQPRVEMRYTPEQTTHWLTFLARQMKRHNQTMFFMERMQPDWLEDRRVYRVYERFGVRLPALLIGALAGLLVCALSLGDTSFSALVGFIPGGVVLGFIPGGIMGGLFSGKRFGRPPGEKKRKLWRRGHPPLTNAGHLRNGVYAGLIGGLIVGWMKGLQFGLMYGFPDGLYSGLLDGLLGLITIGLIGLLVSVIVGGSGKTIQPAETIVWSSRSLWQSLTNAKHLRNGLLLGLIVGLIDGLIVGLVDGPIFAGLFKGLGFAWSPDALQLGLMMGLIFLLSTGLVLGLGYWLLLGLFQGVSSDMLPEHHRRLPNQGIRQSGRNSILLGVIGGLISAFTYILLTTSRLDLQSLLFSWLLPEARYTGGGPLGSWPSIGFEGLIVGLVGGVLAGLLMGGLASLRQLVLRWLLCRSREVPWNYPRFLDHATERVLLRRVGGGYMFVHRLLLEYFASLDSTLDEARAPALPAEPAWRGVSRRTVVVGVAGVAVVGVASGGLLWLARRPPPLTSGIRVLLVSAVGARTPSQGQLDAVRATLSERLAAFGLENARVSQLVPASQPTLLVEVPHFGGNERGTLATLLETGNLEFWNTGQQLLQEGSTLDPSQFGGTPAFSSKDLDPDQIGMSQTGQPALTFEMKGDAIANFGTFTKNNIGNFLTLTLDRIVISSAFISGAIDGPAVITGNFTQQQVTALVSVLKYPPLPVALQISSETTFTG